MTIETNAERLEEIKVNAAGVTDNENNFVDVVYLDVDDYAWLIAQAKRVDMLQKTIREHGDTIVKLYDNLEGITRQNKRYREALKNTKYAIHTQISSINHKENTELENQYIRGMTFSMDMINQYFDEALEGE